MLSATNLLITPAVRHRTPTEPVIVDGIATTRGEEFIKKAHTKYGNKFDYSLVDYISSADTVWIICPDHGKFRQSPANHLQGADCTICVAYRRRDANNAK